MVYKANSVQVLQMQKNVPMPISIQAVINFFQLRWHSIKELEKRVLKRKYSLIKTSHIKAIGIDEIYVSRSQDKGKYLTIIRDLGSGAVIHMGDGKGI